MLAFQRGETTESERQRIHRHIDGCDDCRRLLIATAALENDEAFGLQLDSMERMASMMGSGLRMTTFAEGKRLAHRFDVVRFVDRGGMGEVYEAFDRVLGSCVALKALLCSDDDQASGASRLCEEVKLARRVAHPNVCRIYDLHEHREMGHQPLWFLAMEFVEGVTLKEHLLTRELSIEEACSIARQLLLGVGAVHAAGVLHLDFKTQNVMLRSGAGAAQAVVMDFSLSRAFEKELRLRTSERRVAGSVGYMSPEQLECQSTLGPAADVYAFGVVFYEMLTRRMPFEGDSPAAIMLKQLKSRPLPPSRSRAAIPPALDDFVLTCLSRHARSRFQSVESALEALGQFMQPAASRPRKARASRPVGVVLLAVGGALLAAGGVALVHLASRTLVAEASMVSEPAPPNAVSPPSPPLPPLPPADFGAAAPAGSPASGAVSPLVPPSDAAPVRPRPSPAGEAAPVARSRGTEPRTSGSRSESSPAGNRSLPAPPRGALPAVDGAEVPASKASLGGQPPEPPPASDAKRERQPDWSPRNAPDFLL